MKSWTWSLPCPQFTDLQINKGGLRVWRGSLWRLSHERWAMINPLAPQKSSLREEWGPLKQESVENLFSRFLSQKTKQILKKCLWWEDLCLCHVESEEGGRVRRSDPGSDMQLAHHGPFHRILCASSWSSYIIPFGRGWSEKKERQTGYNLRKTSLSLIEQWILWKISSGLRYNFLRLINAWDPQLKCGVSTHLWQEDILALKGVTSLFFLQNYRKENKGFALLYFGKGKGTVTFCIPRAKLSRISFRRLSKHPPIALKPCSHQERIQGTKGNRLQCLWQPHCVIALVKAQNKQTKPLSRAFLMSR